MQIPRYILLLLAVLVFALTMVSLMYVWFPDMITQDVYARILITFAVVVGGSVFLSLVGGLLAKSAPKDSKTDDKTP